MGACRSTSPSTVVVYTSVDDVFARPIAETFQKDTGIGVQLVPDTEETKSTGLLNRLIAEKERPQADVFWSGDPVRAALLKAKGVSAPYRSPLAIFTVMANAPETLVAALCLVYVAAAAALLAALWAVGWSG